jgi:hypothetical protein
LLRHSEKLWKKKGLATQQKKDEHTDKEADREGSYQREVESKVSATVNYVAWQSAKPYLAP